MRGISTERYPGLAILSEPMHAKLYQTIRSRGFNHIVTNFHIIFKLCRFLQPKRTGWRCTCDKFDAMLGQVILSLQNLQVLHFGCSGCDTQGPYHHYLTELPTKKLQKFLFSCTCRHYFPNKTCQILAAPCMAPITSLCLTDLYKQEDWSVLSTRDCLPHLKKLVCIDIKLIEALLPKRTITHLSFPVQTQDLGRLHDIISQTSCSLAYLQVYNMGHIIPDIILMDSAPYRGLKHLGVLDFINVSVRDFSESF
jgi:hypothetical protein